MMLTTGQMRSVALLTAAAAACLGFSSYLEPLVGSGGQAIAVFESGPHLSPQLTDCLPGPLQSFIGRLSFSRGL